MGLVALHPVATPNFGLSEGSMRAKKRENRGGNDGKFCRKEQKFFDFCLFFSLKTAEKSGLPKGAFCRFFTDDHMARGQTTDRSGRKSVGKARFS